MFIDFESPSIVAALGGTKRSNRPEVRNPLLALPSAKLAADMPPAARDWLILFLGDIRRDSQIRAAHAWRKHKPPLAVYWKVVATLAGHIAKVLRHTDPRRGQP